VSIVPRRVVAVAAGLLPEALAKEAHCTGSTAAGSSTSATAGQGSTGNSSSSGSGTPVLITYGDRDELITRDRVDRWAELAAEAHSTLIAAAWHILTYWCYCSCRP
jgi:alpha-beta hydrolase superfamily lysophospholipase